MPPLFFSPLAHLALRALRPLKNGAPAGLAFVLLSLALALPGGVSTAQGAAQGATQAARAASPAPTAPATQQTPAAARNPGRTPAQPAVPPAASAPSSPPVSPAPPISLSARVSRVPGEMPAPWLALVQRLTADGLDNAVAHRYFLELADYSSMPMAAKIKELFRLKFTPRPPRDPNAPPPPPPSRIYKNVVTAANMQKCQTFLDENKAAFDAVERAYPVPRNILASLLLLETKLGTYTGSENAFWSLACMAAAVTPASVEDGITELPLKPEHAVWLQGRLTDKSEWAYKELKAFLTYCNVNSLDPHEIPGSVYGAIGYCQFMPSNINRYAVDGDGDGIINLFTMPDAIFSAANYLAKHGWKADSPVADQRKIIMRYNHSSRYANTILTMAESLRTGTLQTDTPDAPKPAPASPGGKGKDTKGRTTMTRTTGGQPAGQAVQPAAGISAKTAPASGRQRASATGTQPARSSGSSSGAKSSSSQAGLP